MGSRQPTVNETDIARVVPSFSVNALAGAERDHLRTTFREADTALTSTVQWVLSCAAEGPITAGDLIARTYRASAGGNALEGPPLAYAQYELLRRVHFALELTLQAVTRVLDEGPRSIRRVATVIASEELEPGLLRMEILASSSPLATRTLAEFNASLTEDRLIGPVLRREARTLERTSSQVAYALGLLLFARNAVLRSSALAPASRTVAEAALALVRRPDITPLREVVADLITFVVERHLYTTFRKMAGGQPCSLRFVSEGGRLERTDQATGAGMSGDRLTNLLVMLADVGYLARVGKSYAIADDARSLLQ